MNTTRRRTPKLTAVPDDGAAGVPIPTFSEMAEPEPDVDPDEVQTTSPSLGSHFVSGLPRGFGGAPGPATRTGASSAGTTTPVSRAATERNAAKIIAAIVAIGLGTTGFVLARAGRRLREPSPDQVDRFAEPLAAIAARHIDAAKINADLADAAAAAVPLSEWLREGPIAPPAHGRLIQVGMETADDHGHADGQAADVDAYPPPPVVEAQIAEGAWHLATRDPSAKVQYQN